MADQGEALARLAALRASGAISQTDFERLSAAVSAPPQAPGASPSPGAGHGARQGPSMLRVAGAVAGGVVAGSLAADLLRNALADPPPEILTADIVSTTTLTDSGYVTDSTVTWENADGEVVGEQDFTSTVTYDDQSAGAGYQDAGGYDAGGYDSGGDFGGMEF